MNDQYNNQDFLKNIQIIGAPISAHTLNKFTTFVIKQCDFSLFGKQPPIISLFL